MDIAMAAALSIISRVTLPFFVSHGPKDSGQKGRGQAKAGADSKKCSAIKHEFSRG